MSNPVPEISRDRINEARFERLRRTLPLRPQTRKSAGDDDRGSGTLTVRLAPRAAELAKEAAFKADTLGGLAKAAQLRGLERALDTVGQPRTQRLIRSVPVDKLLEMERQAANSEFPPLRSLTEYWRVDLRERSRDERRKLVSELKALPEVDEVWEDPTPTPPLVTPGDDPYNATQAYQDAAPTGIDARWMWTQPNGEGAGIGVIDVEGGWLETHEDLAAKTPTMIYGTENPSWVEHGTAVLGEIAAIDNTAGVVGTAPAISNIRMCSIFDSSLLDHVADAIVAAAAASVPGAIILIEVQLSFLPVEIVDANVDAIRLATALGILVVEAAGNGDSDLDAYSGPNGFQFNRGSGDFVDSGALMVGACTSPVPHERWWASNYGSRIDCFAYGENVTTIAYGDLDDGGGDPNRAYTNTFQGTSSASPIIVSAAALVQSRYAATTGTLLSPGQMRALLSNPATGTAQGTTVPGAIGVMPNLAAVVPTLGLLADIYLRDAVGDTGAIPWTGAISSSPDVIVRPSPVVNPQATYGEGSGTENSSSLGYTVEAGQDNSLYVRVRNRGGVAATNVVATVYWSNVATLVTPSSWNLIGSVTIPSVPTGDVLTVSDEIPWLQANIPATGHYCFVATLSIPGDPAPPTPGTLTWNEYYDLIRAHNNVTWRNFNVENNLPDTPSATPPSYAFNITGADDQAIAFGFEIARKLPQDADLVLEGPAAFLNALRGRNDWRLIRGEKRENGLLVLPRVPRITLSDVRLPRGARIPCRLTIQPKKGRVVYGHGVAIRQLYKGDEVGRVAWQFAPEAKLYEEK